MYHSSSLTFRLMTASEYYLTGTLEVANVFIPLEFNKGNDLRSHWQRASMSWHNGMCGWVQLINEHVSAHHLEVFKSLGHTTISATPNSFIEMVVPPSCESFSRVSSTASIAHAGTLMNTHQGLGSVWSEHGFTSSPFEAEVPTGFKTWVDIWMPRSPH